MSFNQKAIAVIFEVTHGCQYSCSGCTVNKHTSKLPQAAGFAKLNAFLDDLVSNDVDLVELELGPTDILSSLNRDEVFDHPQFAPLVQRFRLFTLITGLLLPKPDEYIRLAQQINRVAPGVNIELVTPVELTHVYNDKYMRTLERNAQVLKDHLEGPLTGIILQVNFDARFVTQRPVGMPPIDTLFDRIHSLDMPAMTKVNFSFPHGRSKLESELVAGNFLDSIKALNEFYIKDLKRRGALAEKRHVPYQMFESTHSGEVLWHNEELYIRPILNERFTILNEERKFAEPWTYENFVATDLTMTNRALDKAMEVEDCSVCEHVVSCGNRGVQDVMAVTGAKECIMLLKDYGHLRTLLQNGEFDKIDWNTAHAGQ